MYRTESKIVSLDALKALLMNWRIKGDQIVFTNGCFDILHLGHVDYLEKAHSLGNRLVVGLNSDESVSSIKGAARPVQDQNCRARVLAALEFVDAVVLFSDATPENLIAGIKPDVLVKGKDYQETEITGAQFVRSSGGTVETIDLVEGYSTSRIMQKIRS